VASGDDLVSTCSSKTFTYVVHSQISDYNNNNNNNNNNHHHHHHHHHHHRNDQVTPSIRKKLALTWPTSGGRSVGVVRSRTKATELFIIA
jgi:hypothetical protein